MEHNDEDLLFEDSKVYKARPLRNIKVFRYEANVYGEALTDIFNMNIAGDEIVIPFAYDWRLDNRINAISLHNMLCEQRSIIGNRPIYFISHSMGGLVTKYWYELIYTRRHTCNDGISLILNIREFIFAGTPHQGSPSAVLALASGYSFAENAQTIYGKFSGAVANMALAEKLNQAGAFFTSAFQLLPIYNDSCTDPRGNAILPAPIVTAGGGRFELFDALAWKKVGWPRHIGSSITYNEYYANFLSKRLPDAKRFLCEIAEFDPDQVIKITYFIGILIKTPSSFKLDVVQEVQNVIQNVSLRATEFESGDGTVPARIAMNMTDTNRLHHWQFIVNGSHQALLDAIEVKEYLANIFRLYNAEVVDEISKNAGQRRKIIDALEKRSAIDWLEAPKVDTSLTGYIFDFSSIGSINMELMKRRGITTDELKLDDSGYLALGLDPSASASSDDLTRDTIKVGVLHSLSGKMAISETTLKDVMLMLIEEQNKKGGVLGKQLEAVVVDPASDWPRFAELARKLLTEDKVAATFGCWTSVSRKSVLPVFEELNGILFYPVQYEGEESSKNIFYTGAAPNQQAIPAVDYLAAEGVERWVLAGTDYVYPRTTNKILEAYLKAQGVADEDIMINYTPFGHSDWQNIVADIKKFGSAGKKTAVVSTINGDANVPFYKELANQGIKATDIPVVAFSVGEEELAGLDTQPLVGHLAAWNYFMSVDTPENDEFIEAWQTFIKNDKRVTNDPMEAHVIGFNMWVAAVEKAGTTDPEAVIDAMIGIAVPNLSGGYSAMMPNHHITKPVLIGEIQGDGQFDIVWETPGLVVGDEWSDFLPDSKDLISDWRAPMKCGNFNVATGKCGGATQ